MSPSGDKGSKTSSGLSQRPAAAKPENTVRQFLTRYDFSRGSNNGAEPLYIGFRRPFAVRCQNAPVSHQPRCTCTVI